MTWLTSLRSRPFDRGEGCGRDAQMLAHDGIFIAGRRTIGVPIAIRVSFASDRPRLRKRQQSLPRHRHLRAGVVWTNTFNRFDPASPFGGYKESGYGREGGRHGLEGYLRTPFTQPVKTLERAVAAIAAAWAEIT